MQSDDLGLVDRLRRGHVADTSAGGPVYNGADPLMDEAAAAIERLVAERDEADNALVDKYRDPRTGVFSFPGDVAKIIARLEAVEAQRDKLKEALKPFAEAAESIDDTVPDRAEMWEAPAAMETTAGDFRRARQSLKDAP